MKIRVISFETNAYQFTLEAAEEMHTIEMLSFGSVRGTRLPTKDRQLKLRRNDDSADLYVNVGEWVVETPDGPIKLTDENFWKAYQRV